MSETVEKIQLNEGSAQKARGPWRAELRALLVLGAPMAATQLVQFSINTVDVLMIGRLGPEPLAGASLGLVMFFAVMLIGFGPAMAMSPLVSQAIGAKGDDYEDVRKSVRMGLWTTVLIFPVALAIFLMAGSFARATGQPPGPTAIAGGYVLALAPGLPFALGVIMLRNFLAAIGKTRVPLYFIVATTFFNAGLNWLLIYGNWGFPALGVVGAGLASSIAHALGFFLLVLYSRFEADARKFEILKDFFRPDWARLKEVARLGWPISVAIGFEAMLFNASVFLMGRIGVDEMAAYQVALNVAAIAFMAPLGLSMAGGVRVGLARGAGDEAGVRRASVVTVAVCAATIMLVAIPVMLWPRSVAGLYLNALDPANAAVIALVAAFLPIAAAFALFDATQVAAAQCLRGLKDVRVPMILTGFSYWIVGFPLAAWLGLGTEIGAVGVWYGLLASLVCASLTLGTRLWLLVQK